MVLGSKRINESRWCTNDKTDLAAAYDKHAFTSYLPGENETTSSVDLWEVCV